MSVSTASVSYRWAGSSAPKRCHTCVSFTVTHTLDAPVVAGSCHVNGDPGGPVHVRGLILANHVCADWEGTDAPGPS